MLTRTPRDKDWNQLPMDARVPVCAAGRAYLILLGTQLEDMSQPPSSGQCNMSGWHVPPADPALQPLPRSPSPVTRHPPPSGWTAWTRQPRGGGSHKMEGAQVHRVKPGPRSTHRGRFTSGRNRPWCAQPLRSGHLCYSSWPTLTNTPDGTSQDFLFCNFPFLKTHIHIILLWQDSLHHSKKRMAPE